SLKEGIAAAGQKGTPKPRIIKATTLADITSYYEHVAASEGTELSPHRAEALKILKDLQADPESLHNFKRQVLVQQGLELLDEDACPLCDTSWDMKELQAHLQQKLNQANEAAVLLGKLEEAVQPLANNLEDIKRAAAKVIATCALADPKL